MTSFSARLLAYPEPMAREALEHFALDNERLQGLPGLPDRFGPFDLSKWAEGEGLDVFYVDNCWVRVPVSADQLRAFCSAHIAPELNAGLARIIAIGEHYLLEAEEF